MVSGFDNIMLAMSTIIPVIRESQSAQNGFNINMEYYDQAIKQLLYTHCIEEMNKWFLDGACFLKWHIVAGFKKNTHV